MSTIYRARLRPGLTTAAVVPLVTVGLATTSLAAPDGGPAPQSVTQATAAELAAAMASPSVTVTGARFQTQADPRTAGVGDSPLTGFPTAGGTFAILSTGDVADVPLPGTFASTDFGSPGVRGDEHDTTVLEVDIDVPTGANCLAVDARFLSEDHWITWPHDAFIAELDDSTWATPAIDVPPFLVQVLAPDNFADKPEELELPGQPITAHPWAELGFAAENGAGTAFDGGASFGMATKRLVAQTPVTPGAHTVYFSIFDTGGDDSAVFLDNLRLDQVVDAAVDCAPGARPLTHQVELTPASATAQTGTEHTVTATVTDASGGAAAAGTSVELTVTGANPATGTVATTADGTATFAYTGTATGTDVIRACVRPAAGLPCSALTDASVTWAEGPPPPGAERVAGTDRYGTAAAVAEAWAPGVDLVYVTSGLAFPDAVTAGALGGLHDAPVLLTRPDRVPDATTAALTRLLPQRIVVLGGEAAVSGTVLAELADLAQADTDDEVTRVAGSDRYATAAAAAATYPTGVGVAYVASGAAFPDSVTGSARAGAEGGPVLLTRPGSLPDVTAEALTALQPGRIVVLGGAAAVEDVVLAELAALTDGDVTRMAGADRYGTAAAIAGDHAPGVEAVFVASGAGFADSLSSAPWAASLGAPVLLTRPGALPTATATELERLDPARIIVLGGSDAVSEEVRQALAAYLE